MTSSVGCSAAASRLLLGVAEQLDSRRAAERHQAELVGVDEPDRMGGELGVGVAEQGVALLDQPRAVVLWDAEQRAEHAHRELLGDAVDEVERRLAGERLADDLAGERADRLLVGVDLAAAERLGHEAPVGRVLGRVELHHRPPRLGLLGVHLLEADALGAGERADVAADLEQVGVAGHRPEPAAAGVVLRPPAHRVVATQAEERGVRNAGVYVSGSAMSASAGPRSAIGPRHRSSTRSLEDSRPHVTAESA